MAAGDAIGAGSIDGARSSATIVTVAIQPGAHVLLLLSVS